MNTLHITIFPSFLLPNAAIHLLSISHLGRVRRSHAAAGAQIAMLANRPLGPFLFSLHCAGSVRDTNRLGMLGSFSILK